MAGSVTLYDAIDSHVRRLQNNLYTALPAIVKSYNSDTQTVSVLPALNRKIDDVHIPWVTIPDVPVMFPSAGGGLLSFPINEGDTVLLVFSKNSIDQWKAGDGSEVDLNSNRSHSVSDAIAIVGLYTTNTHLEPNPEDVELKFNDNRITLKADGAVEIKSNTTIRIENNEVELIDLLGQLIDTINAITVNTVYGTSPINNIVDFQLLKTQLDTLKG